MKHVLYEVTDDFDIVIKLTFENYSYLDAFIEQHTKDKKYEPKFLVLEINDEGDIDFIRTYNGTKEISKRYVVEFIDQWYYIFVQDDYSVENKSRMW